MVPLSPTTPSWSLVRGCHRAGVPFVVGPINGGVPWPKAFDSVRRAEREWLTYVRSAYKLLPGYRATRALASAVIVGSEDTYRLESDRWRSKMVYCPENAIDPERFPRPEPGEIALPLRCAFIGRLVPYKGADMLIEAASDLARAGQIEVDVFGDGPEMDRLKGMVSERSLGERIRLRGWVKHEDLQAELKRSHLFTFPSIREFGGGVVLEAMACGLVPMVVGYGGPNELVTDRTGYRIPIGTREAIVSGFRQMLERAVGEVDRLGVMSEACVERVHRHFTWDAKARQTLEVYRWVTGERADKPDFGMPLPDEG